jgi:pimeloyl-CoA synthetase
MLTKEDIENLARYFKEIFATKADLAQLEGRFDVLQTSVDKIVKDNEKFFQELKVMNYRVKNVESWIDKAAPKVGIHFEK